jgi:hypothetical protein
MFYHVANYNHPRVCQNFCHGSVHLVIILMIWSDGTRQLTPNTASLARCEL